MSPIQCIALGTSALAMHKQGADLTYMVEVHMKTPNDLGLLSVLIAQEDTPQIQKIAQYTRKRRSFFENSHEKKRCSLNSG
jgi:hypothetical protein